MALTDLDTLLPITTPDLPGCSEAIQIATLKRIAREFCRDTEYWRETVSDIDIADEAETIAVPIDATYDAVALRVLSVEVDDVERDTSLWYVTPDGVLTFTEAMTAAAVLTLEVVYLPKLTCHEYPDWLMDRYGEAIAKGAMAALKRQNGRPWTDAEGALANELEYERLKGNAKAENWLGRGAQDKYFTVNDFV